MDLLLYFVIFTSIGVYNIYKNGELSLGVLTDNIGKSDSSDNSINATKEKGILDGMTMGSNPYCYYDKDAFCKILDQFNLR